MIGRRRFLAAAGAALIAPAAVRAQAQRPKRLAIMNAIQPVAQMKSDGHPWYVAFYRELQRLGWQEGQNLVVELWSGLGRSDRDEFVRQVYASKPDIVFVPGYAQFAPQLLRVATAVPTIIFGPDPLATGIVNSLSRPGNSITGFTSDGGIELVGKSLQLLVESSRGVRRVAYYGPRYRWELEQRLVGEAAARLKISVEPALFEAGAPEAEARRVFTAMAAARPDAVLVSLGVENTSRPGLIAEMALAERLPAIGATRVYAESGLLMSYGPEYLAIYRNCAGYVDRILRGAKPSDLPVQQPTIFEFVVNLKTQRALGIELPNHIMAFVSEWIE